MRRASYSGPAGAIAYRPPPAVDSEDTPRTTTTYVDSPTADTHYCVVRAYHQNWESGNSNEAEGYITAVATYTSTADIWADENQPTDTHGSNTEMIVRSMFPAKNGRSYVEFDVSAIPSGSTIVSATLTLCPDRDPSESRTYDVHRVSTSWVETTLTWNNQPSVAASATDSQTQVDALICTTWTVTSDVQAWVDGTANYGWRISDDSEENVGSIDTDYKTREHGDTADRPELVATYR